MPPPRPAPARRRQQSVPSTARSSPRRPAAVDPGAAGHAIPQCRPLHSGYAIRKPPTGSAQPAAPLLHAPSRRACWRSSEPAGRHARSPVVPSGAARPPPVRDEKSIPTSFTPQTWYACLSTLPHLGITESQYYIVGSNDRTIQPELQRFLAARMKAKVTEVASSHVAMLSQPQRVYDVIVDAAASVGR